MLDNNWFIIDGFLFWGFLPLEKILKSFLDNDKKRIL